MISVKNKILFLFILFINISIAQPEKVLNSGEIQLALNKLNVLGSVLYIAAHPDDENTALLSYFSSGKLLRTGYLALTRGDGGQNLIGSEQGDMLGLIRTQELLDARRIDGAEQFFSRAFDFGFSKNPEETFKFWDKNKILSDVVWIIRNFKPDVIVTRFPITGEGGHGHHTASAILAEEAFNIAGTDSFSYQLKYVKPWQPKRLMVNLWLPLLQERKADLSKFFTIDVGKFNTYLGKGYTEISAESRSMHKSQGFGSAGSRGESLNYFEHRFGMSAKNDMFEDIVLSWDRVSGSGKIKELLTKAEKEYDASKPEAILPYLLRAYSEMNKINENYWIPQKKKELLEVIHSLLGIWFEAIATDYSSVPGENISINSNIINRSSIDVKVKKIIINQYETDLGSVQLANGKPFKKEISFHILDDAKFTQPYWLENPHTNGIFNISDQTLIGQAESSPSLLAEFVVDIQGTELKFDTPVMFRLVDPVKGEKYRPFEILPAVTLNFDSKVLLFPDAAGKTIAVRVTNNSSSAKGKINFNIPEGWKVEPAVYEFNFIKKNEDLAINVNITPPANDEVNKSSETPYLKITAMTGGRDYNYSLTRIEYDHIPVQVYLPVSQIKIVRFTSQKKVNNIGYYMGAGDDIPEYIKQLGFNLTMLNDNDLLNGNLNSFDAIITGVRAYNTKSILAKTNKRLIDYVSNGGNLLVQYNVNIPLVTDPGAYSLTLSHDRVTDEKAEIHFIDAGSPLLNYPNKISANDFDGWTQERGLYFAGQWDPKYKTVLSCNDPGEKPLEGGLLYTKYGKGNFVYTGYSFFRHIPAGIPGAIRLFVNLFSQLKMM